MPNTMEIIYKPAGLEAVVMPPYETLKLEEMQELVGGYVDVVYVGHGVDMWINDEGKLMRLPFNVALAIDHEVYDVVCGNVFFASSDSDGETIGLSSEQKAYVMDMLDGDHILGRVESTGELVFLPVMELEG